MSRKYCRPLVTCKLNMQGNTAGPQPKKKKKTLLLHRIILGDLGHIHHTDIWWRPKNHFCADGLSFQNIHTVTTYRPYACIPRLAQASAYVFFASNLLSATWREENCNIYPEAACSSERPDWKGAKLNSDDLGCHVWRHPRRVNCDSKLSSFHHLIWLSNLGTRNSKVFSLPFLN